jgi:glycosyltransferase involved in cell wall biosynthesis
MSDLKISIVTPSFNQIDFLGKTIESVLSQNYSNLQYVVIDGGSQDGSDKVISKYKDRLHYSCSEKDSGHAEALNKGFEKTDGEIMGWINSDDMYLPGCFNAISQIFMAFPDIAWITGFSSVWNKFGSMTQVESVHKNIYDFMNGNYDWIQQESTFWRRSLWNKAGGQINQDVHFAVDGDLWSRFFIHERLVSVSCGFGGYRYHGKNRAFENMQNIKIEVENSISKMMQSVETSKLQLSEKVKKFRSETNNGKSMNPISYFTEDELEEISYRHLIFNLASGKWEAKYLPFKFT